MDYLEDILVPIFICVVLPVALVWLSTWGGRNKVNRRSQVLIEAIKANPNIGGKSLVDLLNDEDKRSNSPEAILQNRLQRGLMWSLIGVAMFVLALICTNPMSDSRLVLLFASCVSIAVGVAFLVTFFFQKRRMAMGYDRADDDKENGPE